MKIKGFLCIKISAVFLYGDRELYIPEDCEGFSRYGLHPYVMTALEPRTEEQWKDETLKYTESFDVLPIESDPRWQRQLIPKGTKWRLATRNSLWVFLHPAIAVIDREDSDCITKVELDIDND